MSEEKYVGLDVHQSSTVAAVHNERGKRVMESILETQSETIQSFLKGYCQLEAKSPVFETKSSNSRTVNQQLKGFCGRSKRQRMAQVDNTF